MRHWGRFATAAAIALSGALPAPAEAPTAMLVLTAERASQGAALNLTGTAPGENEAKRLILAAGIDAEVALDRVSARPDAEAWTEAAAEALAALRALETGRLEISGETVQLSGTAKTGAVLQRLRTRHPGEWFGEIAIRSPSLALTLEETGTLRVEGWTPPGFRLRAPMPGHTLKRSTSAALEGDAKAWERALDALGVVFPRLSRAGIAISPGHIEIVGQLREGFSGPAARSALTATLGTGWEVALRIQEAPPDAAVSFTRDADGLHLQGMLPYGIAPAHALTLAGGDAQVTLATGGQGHSAEWAVAIAVLGRLATVYENAEGEIAEGFLRIDGTFRPGYDAGLMRLWARHRLPESWELTVEGTSPEVPVGAVRIDPESGRREKLHATGHWLSIFAFRPTAEACTDRAEALLKDGPIRFLSGGAEIDAVDARRLDALAGLAIHCAAWPGTMLEVGGHTDDVGDPAANMRLSERRAEAARRALIARGVPEERLTARGFGEAEPRYANTTERGRAGNRRIGFVWRDTARSELPAGMVIEGEPQDE